MAGMSVENMTNVSYLFFALSGAFAVSAAVLFFAFDIAKCWRMVSGKRFAHRETQQGKNKTAVIKRPKAVLPDCTVGAEETEVIDNNMEQMEIIQDIVYMQDAGIL